MWRLEHTEMLWWLVLLPLTFMLAFWIKRRIELKWKLSGGNPARIRSLLNDPSKNYRKYRKLAWSSAFILLVLAMANLQMGEEKEKVSYKGSNVIVALDLSNSMLASDVAPDRLERAKKLITRLMEQLGGDRVAFIVFAGKAYLQLPFTSDYSAVELQLSSVNPDMMPTQGTALGEAIQLAMSLPVKQYPKEKILIMLSDGEDHDTKAISLARKAASKGITVYTIGVGTEKGGYVPEYDDNDGNTIYKRDAEGNIVLSRLNEENLRNIAQAGKGKYFNISNERKAIREITKEIRWKAVGQGEERIYTRYKSYFQWFLFPAILLLLLEMLLFEGVSLRLLINKDAGRTLVFFAVIIVSACRQPVNTSYSQAFKLYQEGNFKESQQLFREAARQDSQSADLALFGMSAVFQNTQQYDSAIYYLDSVLSGTTDTSLKHYCYFNKGNILYEKRQFRESVRMYEEALKLKPGHYRSQYNLSLALAHITPDPEQHQQDKKSGPQEKKDDQKNDQDKKENRNDSKEEEQKNTTANNEKNNQDEKIRNEEKPNQSSENREQQQRSAKPGSKKINPANLERLFQQLDREEKAVQKRVYQQAGKNGIPPKVEKDW